MKKRTLSQTPRKPTPPPSPPEQKQIKQSAPFAITTSAQFEPYCKNCPNMEIEVKTHEFCGDGITIHCDIVVSCKYAERCKRLVKYLEG